MGLVYEYMANGNLIDYLSGLLIPELYYNILGRRSYNLFFLGCTTILFLQGQTGIKIS